MNMLRLTVILVLLCFGCQTGRIPCPKIKGPKLIKSGKRYKAYSSTFPARIEPKEVVANREKPLRQADVKFTKNVSVEEWDCPQPGGKKYLPKNVKENIRRNTRKMRDDLRQNSTDSTSAQP